MKKRGISLIVLIITIVVIIILATAIIVNLAQTNIIGNANMSVFKSDVSTMQDELSMYISDKYMETLGKYEPEKLQATEEGIWYGSKQEEGTITDILKSMNEKYIRKLFIQDGKLVANKLNITVEEEKWLNDIGIVSSYQTDIGKIEITPSTIDWIDGDVTLLISYTKEIPQGYTLEYKVNEGEFQEGTQVVVEENNTTVTARLYSNEKDNEALSNSYVVSNIDKDIPTIPTSLSLEVTGNTITATASGSTDGTSGVLKYEYKTDNSEWQDSGTFSGIKAGVETTIYARAVDKVGHKSESKSNSGAPTVPTISGLTLELTGTYTNSYFKDSVTPKVTYTSISTSAYVLQYKVGSGSWTTVASGTTLSAITENNTNIVFRLYNSSLSDEVTSGVTLTRTINGGSSSAINTYQYNISNLDTDTPTTPTTLNLSKSGNTITAKASGSTDGTSGVLKYEYSKDNSTWQDSGSFTELTYGSTYTIYARAVDKVEHTSSNKSNSITLDKLNGGVTLSATSGTVCVSKSTKFTVSKNTSGGNLSVKSSNTSVATVSISEAEVTITGTSTAGTATITVTSAATSSYNAASATYTVTVAAHSATTGGNLKTSATCTAAAVYYHKCSRCGEQLTSTYTSGNALGHDYSSKTTTSTYLKSSATCTEAATYYYKCSRCTAKGTSMYTSGSALGHDYIDTELNECDDNVKEAFNYIGYVNVSLNGTYNFPLSAKVGDIFIAGYYGSGNYEWIKSINRSYNSNNELVTKYSIGSLGSSFKVGICSRCGEYY